VDSLNIYPKASEKLQVQAQRMQNTKNKLHEQLANTFAEERKGAVEQQLLLEAEKLRGNELRQILEGQMLERHQLREEQEGQMLEMHQRREEQRVRYEHQRMRSEEEQRVRYESQHMRSEASERQQRKKRDEKQRVRSAASEQQQRKKSFDSSSDEEDVQVVHRGTTAFLKSVTAEDTRSQAPADVAEEEREAGSPAKSAGTRRRSSAGSKLSDPSDAGVSTPSAKGTSSQARGSRAAEKSDNSSEDDNDTHRRGVTQVMADFEMVGEAYRQGFIHYHAGEIAKHIEQMAIGPGASDYGPSDDENQRAVGSNGTAVCNRAEGQSSDENDASQQHSEYSSADEYGRSERSIESCSSDGSGRSKRNIESCSSDSSGRSERNIESCSSDDSMDW
jgi:hypothetical protein